MTRHVESRAFGPGPRAEQRLGTPMTLGRVVCVAVAALLLGAGPARAQVLPWPGPGTEHLPPDPTVPYLPAVPPVICPAGEPACIDELATELERRTGALGCSHDAVFGDAYVTITRALVEATGTAGVLRPPRPRPARGAHVRAGVPRPVRPLARRRPRVGEPGVADRLPRRSDVSR